MKKIMSIFAVFFLIFTLSGCSSEAIETVQCKISFEESDYNLQVIFKNEDWKTIVVDDVSIRVKLLGFWHNDLYEQTFILNDYEVDKDKQYNISIPDSEIVSATNLGSLYYEIYQNDTLIYSYTNYIDTLQVANKYDAIYEYASQNGEVYTGDMGNGYTVGYSYLTRNWDVTYFEDGRIVLNQKEKYGIVIYPYDRNIDYDDLDYEFSASFMYTEQYPIYLETSFYVIQDIDNKSFHANDASSQFYELNNIQINLENFSGNLDIDTSNWNSICSKLTNSFIDLIIYSARNYAGIVF